MKIRNVKKFTIDRKVWLRGENEGYLYRKADHKMCCVGIYLHTCGVPKSMMSGDACADDLSLGDDLPEWMLNAKITDSHSVCAMYDANDNSSLKAPEREKKVASLFKKHGVEVKFIN